MALAVAMGLMVPGAGSVEAEPVHALAMHGKPRYPAGFSHFDYVNPQAPKGGTITLSAIGTFDSLNPYVIRGRAATGLHDYVFESLLTRSRDEPFSLYGLLAETVDLADDGSSVTFTLNPKARFADGVQVTPEDVIFSWRSQRDEGRPNLRLYYSKVEKAEKVGDHGVRFVLADRTDRELPMILGLMPVLPRHRYDQGRASRASLERPLGSGPYQVADVSPGASITYQRNPDYWGRDLPVNRGRFNFDTIRVLYFRSEGSAFEAFKKGIVDVFLETDPARWVKAYDFPARKRGEAVQDVFRSGLPAPMQAFVFNTRRRPLDDIRVREALILLFEADWINRNLFFGQFRRNDSYFTGSELSSAGRPAAPEERLLLAPYPDAVRPDIMDGSYRLPAGASDGRDRENRRRALSLLAEAGFEVRDGALRDRAGRPLSLEFLAPTREMERLALAYARSLAAIGIRLSIRQVDSSQFQARLNDYDFDLIPYTWHNSLSPGNEQFFYWGSEAADRPGTRNYMGARQPAIDAMIRHMLAAENRDELIVATRALDRVLMSGMYVLPLFHPPGAWIGRWSRMGYPETTPLFGFQLDTWWTAEKP